MARHLGPVPDNWAEQETLKQLQQQLPADWTIVSDVSWAVQVDDDRVSDGQADLVVLAPGHGMVVVEVKGTRRIWIDDDGRWYREDPRGDSVLVKKRPTDQAMGSMHTLAKVIQAKGGWSSFPGKYAWIVAYPFGEATHVPALFDESTLITRRHMHDLARRMRHALERRGKGHHGAAFTEAASREVARILTSRPFAVVREDGPADVRNDEEHIDKLTRQQFAALRGIFEFPKVAVTGPAGSGKTLLAIWRLQALVDAGKRALYVCYNKDLASMLRGRHRDCQHSITHVDKFFSDMVPMEAKRRRPTDLAAYFRDELPSAVLDVAARMRADDRYDAIIVDEGQDFSEFQLLALAELLKDNESQWLIFSDKNQDVYRPGAGEEMGAEVVFRLFYNCRNTTEVNDATNRFVDAKEPVESMPGMPRGEPPTVACCGSRDGTAKRAWEIAKSWATEHGVAILSPYTLEKSSMAGSAKAHGLELSTNLEDLGQPGKVYFSTIRGFKGIEAPAVILVDVDVPHESEASPMRREDLYVACTRPTSRLAILTRSQGAADWFIQGPLSQAGTDVR